MMHIFLTVGSYPPDILSLIFSSLPHHVKLTSLDFHLVYSATTSRIVIRDFNFIRSGLHRICYLIDTSYYILIHGKVPVYGSAAQGSAHNKLVYKVKFEVTSELRMVLIVVVYSIKTHNLSI